MTEANPLILANLVRGWCEKSPDSELLTFVSIDEHGDFQDETRSYRQLWENGQRLAAWLREEQGLQAGDFDKAERAAHSLKGSSGNLGARLVQDVCEQLQLSTRSHQLAESMSLAPKLAKHYADAEVALRRVLADYQD